MPHEYVHVDVFTRTPYGGNTLPVFVDARDLSVTQMLRITQELRHFEAIFLEPPHLASTVRARVFDQRDELPFAGHPLLGAAAVLHEACGTPQPQTWRIELPTRTVALTTEVRGDGYIAWLDQGPPDFGSTVRRNPMLAEAVGLDIDDLHSDLPVEVVSTGLRYLIIPVIPGAIARAQIRHDITSFLHDVGAQFAVLLDEANLEIRHWNNDGIVEDIATGSAAGTIGAYRLRHKLLVSGAVFTLHQGRFVGRPSTLRVMPEGTPDAILNVRVGGDVVMVGHGQLDVLP